MESIALEIAAPGSISPLAAHLDHTEQGAGLHSVFHRHRSSDETAFVASPRPYAVLIRICQTTSSSLVRFTSSCGDYVTMHLGTYQSRL
jgi:hypothetical protein